MADIFDVPRPPALAYQVFQKLVKEMTDAGLEVLMISGNHDMSDPEWCHVVPGVQPLSGRTWERDGCTVTGLSWRPRVELEAALKDLPDADILVCHQLLDLTCPLDGMWNMQASWVPAKFHTVILGDYHPPVSVPGKPAFHYTGAPAAMSMSETTHDQTFLVVNNGYVGRYTVPTRLTLSHRTSSFCDVLDQTARDQLAAFMGSEFDQLRKKHGPAQVSLDNIRDPWLRDVCSPTYLSQPLVQIRYDPQILGMSDLQALVDNRAYLASAAQTG